MYNWNINVSVPIREQNKIIDELDLKIYVVTSHFNLHKSTGNLLVPRYSTYIQAGAALTKKLMCELRDNIGEKNISINNPMYCELTALYWIWKNELPHDYIGFNLYSRIFELSEEQLIYILANGIDVIVPEPEILSPLFKTTIQASKEINNFLKTAISKICPSYLNTYEDSLKEKICIPSNLIIAKKEIFSNYTEWLFKMLSAYENLLKENLQKMPLRHIGYMAERLMTVYFLHHSEDLNIFFARRRFLI